MTSERVCPDCAHPGNRGSFCTECGAGLESTAACARCDTPLADPTAYCPGCGRAVAGSIRRARALAGIGAVVAAVSIGWIAGAWYGGESEGNWVRGGASVASAAAVPDISAMSPRERADRLFDRVMRAVATGDSAEARQFVPMAVAAHQQIERLDADLRFHLAVLGLIDERPEVAAAQARAILEETSTHLFGLHSAAQAAAALGDDDAARLHYRRLLSVYNEEAVLDRPEYAMHAPLIPRMRRDAERFLEAER